MTSPHILIVDDNQMNIELVSFLLQANGIEVSAALNASVAKICIAARAPDLILMDIQLPDVDGLTLTAQLKGDEATRHIPVVAFTAYAMKGDEARMRAAGCDGYLSKPIDVANFTATVRSYLKASTPDPS